jgi:flagellar protein FlaG
MNSTEIQKIGNIPRSIEIQGELKSISSIKDQKKGEFRNLSPVQVTSQKSQIESALKSDGLGEIEGVMEQMNKFLESANIHLQFGVHEESGRIFTRVVNMETKEIIKEFPPEEMLNLIARIDKAIGVFIDEIA